MLRLESKVARIADAKQTGILALPQPLLEHIYTKDKKALRQACKFFRHTVDGRLVSTCLQCDEDQKGDCLTKFLQHLQQSQCLQTLSLHADPSPRYCFDRFLNHLPTYLTTLLIHGEISSLKPLKHLPRLNTLALGRQVYGREDLADITGLTRLECCIYVGSLAHLAPTLKQLSITSLGIVQDLGYLTKLKILEVHDNLPGDFFATYGHLQIETICIQCMVCPESNNCTPLNPGFEKLTRLTLQDDNKIVPGSLPNSIHTWLQLLDAREENFEETAAALPRLRALDLCLQYAMDLTPDVEFAHLSRLTNLHTLGLRIEYPCHLYYTEDYLSSENEHASDCYEEEEQEDFSSGGGGKEDCHANLDNLQGGVDEAPYKRLLHIPSREEILRKLPNVLRIVENGVLLDVVESIDDFLGVLGRLRVDQTLWASVGANADEVHI